MNEFLYRDIQSLIKCVPNTTKRMDSKRLKKDEKKMKKMLEGALRAPFIM